MIAGLRKVCFLFCLSLSALLALSGHAAEFSASFKGTDINEFINTVSKNLNKTVIVEPGLRGNITVRSYDMLNEEQYYQFFLSVLEVYGFAVIPMENGILKVIKAKDAKTATVPDVDDGMPDSGDALVTRVVPLHNVTARDLAPLLRQLNDNAGVGNVVHYDPSNVLLMTGRSTVINRLMKIIERVDKAGDQTVQTVALKHASAGEVARIVTQLLQEQAKGGAASVNQGRIVADERTNAVLISGEQQTRRRILQMVKNLDKPQERQGNTRVIYLRFANAENLVEVLNGVSASISSTGGQTATNTPAGSGALLNNVSIKADKQTNSLIVNASPDMMHELEQVITQLDIRRPQVLVEAIIAEVQNAEGLNLGIQWGNKHAGFTQFTNTGLPISTVAAGAESYRNDGTLTSSLASALSTFNGIAAGFYSGNWGMLITAISNDNKNDILATPSIVTLDNMEATFNVGQEVPVLTGTQTTSADNVFNTVDRKTVGVKLKVKPQITDGGTVMLEIEQEVSSVDENSKNSTLGPTFNTRTVNNAVLIDSGEMVVIGGLLDSKNSTSNSKVPLLGDIPVVGNLFRSKSQSAEKRNLMLFIRPTIIREQRIYTDATNRKYQQFLDAQRPEAMESPFGNGNPSKIVTLNDLEKGRAFNEVRYAIELFYSTSSQENNL